ncbi:MAG: carbohydrate binding family 9 domain-containing protein [Lewinellaceae bacterium]|nr:carbohydrate binding family 9 domain-containing protein [Lewinellaceae bacterium]
MKRNTLLLSFVLFAASLFSQVPLAPKKSLAAARIEAGAIHLDGQLNEPVWQQASTAEGFVFLWPTPGRTATEKSVIKIVYDDHAIYIGALLYDNSPDSIKHRLTKRDELENTDWFAVTFDTYQDGQNALQFGISPDNVQFDSKFSLANANSDNGNADGEDPAWDAVWYSAASITKDGWVAELEIPYSALRFPKQEDQHWNLNFFRRIQRKGETDTWNEVKAEISGSLNQMGRLDGVHDIKAPLRLSVTPFVAAYAENQYHQDATPSSTWSYPFSMGMDLKYGINQAFTLDATIVPDFGQVRTDNFVLNLSPFEQRFDENRPFFTEGTELFNKGGLFYSRRIGSRPPHYWDVYDQVDETTEAVVENPSRAQLLNAAKFSGRTTGGLGIGVFNAIEASSHATVKNLETGEKREIETSPLTNRSVFVFDQNLKNNSSVTLINTNVMRSGADRDANVTGVLFKLKNKAQSYALDGKAAYSSITSPDGNENGYTAHLNLEKTNGNLLWGGSYTIESDRYNPNDLGFLYSPNEKAGYSG